MIDTTPGIVSGFLPDGSSEFFNKRWHDYTGLSPEESRGWGWQTAIHPQDLAQVMDKWREMLASGKAGELEARAKDWKARELGFGSGYLWKYAQQVGPARDGAVTHPGGAAEKACYADI